MFRRDNQRLCGTGVDADMLRGSKGDEAPSRVDRCAVAGGVAVSLVVETSGSKKQCESGECVSA